MTEPAPASLRQRGQWLPMIVAVVVVLFTLANAAANMIPVHRPTAYELQRAEQRGVIVERRARIAALTAAGDGCRPAVAHELVRALVFDGQSARVYADDYERRCGADPVVRHWGDAPAARSAQSSNPMFAVTSHRLSPFPVPVNDGTRLSPQAHR